MNLMPKELKNKIPNIGEQDGLMNKAKIFVKYFNPVGAQTWYITEYDPSDGTMYGLCDLGMGHPELGYVMLQELEALQLPMGMSIERDIHFDTDTTLKMIMK